jgi:hypothetical protein
MNLPSNGISKDFVRTIKRSCINASPLRHAPTSLTSFHPREKRATTTPSARCFEMP